MDAAAVRRLVEIVLEEAARASGDPSRRLGGPGSGTAGPDAVMSSLGKEA